MSVRDDIIWLLNKITDEKVLRHIYAIVNQIYVRMLCK